MSSSKPGYSLAALVASLLQLFFVAAGLAQPIDIPDGASGPKVQVSYLWRDSHVVPGGVAVGVFKFELKPNWHIGAGAGSGEEVDGLISSVIKLRSPVGWSARELQWPRSKKLSVPGLDDPVAVYEGSFPVFVAVEVPADAGLGNVDLEFAFTYQACDDHTCDRPMDETIRTSVEVVAAGGGLIPSSSDAVFATVRPGFGQSAMPVPAPRESEATDTQKPTPSRINAGTIHYILVWGLVMAAAAWMVFKTVTISGKGHWRILIGIIGVAIVCGWSYVTLRLTEPSPVSWVPYSKAVFDDAVSKGDRVVVVEFTASWCINCITIEHTVLNRKDVATRLNEPDVLALKADVSDDDAEGWKKLGELGFENIPLTVVYHPGRTEPSILSSFYTPSALLSAIGGAPVTANLNYGPVMMMLVACLAGLLMNFTPCVLPVIPIKILSIQAHAGNPRKCMMLGLVFSIGIVAMFAVLGILIAGVIGGVQEVGWGSFFQNWWFSAIIGLIVGVMGLGMLGLFNTNLPQFVYLFNPQSDSALGSFLMGGFTAVLSTPCTGPLLGATLAWLLLQPKGIALLTFVVMGIGMALPYLVLTSNPRWVERLPRGGPGSEVLKQVMGLLLLAISVYFLGVAVQGLT